MQLACSQCGLFHASTSACFSLPQLRLPARQPLLSPGILLAGRYHITKVLHRGGSSTVYLADDTILQGREVALKELRVRPDAGLEEVQEAEAWFARESYLLSNLQHQLIPAFYSVFREEQRPYIVQEYIHGENLDDLVRRQGPVTESQALRWARSLCNLLSYLHDQPSGPLIYRDLNPANIVLRARDQRLMVVDFGIARPLNRGEVGTVIGTPGYAPPEQYQGLADERSDVFALGATLHRLLTGYDPEQGQPFTFPPVRSLNPGISAALATIVARAVELDPAQRYPSASALAAALDGVALPKHVPGYPIPAHAHWPAAPVSTTGNWVAAGLVPVAGVSMYLLDPTGLLLLGSLSLTLGARTILAMAQTGTHGLRRVAPHLLVTSLAIGGMVEMLSHQVGGAWSFSFSTGILGMVVAFLVGDDLAITSQETSRRYAGYGLVALLCGAAAFSLGYGNMEIPLPLSFAILVFFGAPGAVVGAFLGWILRTIAR
jgi:tRNA A-37 threonylcarbamoyl transferase component Bud32